MSAARLEVTGTPVVRWEMALREGQDLLDLGDGEFFGFDVDAGMASFMDAANVARLAAAEIWWEMLDDYEKRFGLGPGFGPAGDGDVVAWNSGWGDGMYPVWIGRAADGSVSCLVSDMLLNIDDNGVPIRD